VNIPTLLRGRDVVVPGVRNFQAATGTLSSGSPLAEKLRFVRGIGGVRQPGAAFEFDKVYLSPGINEDEIHMPLDESASEYALYGKLIQKRLSGSSERFGYARLEPMTPVEPEHFFQCR
jgi:hypothetical protein